MMDTKARKNLAVNGSLLNLMLGLTICTDDIIPNSRIDHYTFLEEAYSHYSADIYHFYTLHSLYAILNVYKPYSVYSSASKHEEDQVSTSRTFNGVLPNKNDPELAFTKWGEKLSEAPLGSANKSSITTSYRPMSSPNMLNNQYLMTSRAEGTGSRWKIVPKYSRPLNPSTISSPDARKSTCCQSAFCEESSTLERNS